MAILDKNTTPTLHSDVRKHISRYGLPEEYEHIRVTLMYANMQYLDSEYVMRFNTWTDEQKAEARKLLLKLNNQAWIEIHRIKKLEERKEKLLTMEAK